ncbi:MAG: DmsE family decaheme c-type cytochrome [Acidobacteria bacterium]|nr:DmsE family decaheme c-type cytochrome [Acidobacteriota bacterium]
MADRRLLLKFILCLTPCWIPALAQTPSVALPEGYLGSENCRICHENLGGVFDPHISIDRGQTKKRAALEWKGRTCEACHGPGKTHAEKAEGKDIFVFGGSIRYPALTPAGEANPRCLQCHAADETHRGREFGSHNRNQIPCTQCHSVHQSARRALLRVESTELCEQCHLNVKAEFTRPYRHKLQERAMACVDCHNPHGELPPRQLRRVSANEPGCLKCHGDKRGPFPFEHAPVRLGNCSTCHEPHGSANPRMLIRHDQSFLCLECHTSGTQTIGITPPAFHDLRTARYRNCTICHSKIHGSFASKDLLR